MSVEDVEGIKELKHRYFRHLDLKEIDALGELLIEDATASYGEAAPWLAGREAIVEFLSTSLSGPHIISLHHGHHPEITFVGPDEATGIWYLMDRVIVPGADLEIGGTALYDDRYVRRDGSWLIAHTGYQRVFEEQRRHRSGELISFTSRFDDGG